MHSGACEHTPYRKNLPPKSRADIKTIVLGHVQALHNFYGEIMGPRIARKHVGWYLKAEANEQSFRKQFNALEQPEEQLEALNTFFDTPITTEERAA